jgi:hypothetical protein
MPAHECHRNRQLKPIFSSDVGHFDVVDMSAVLEEADELVEHGLISFDRLPESDTYYGVHFGATARTETREQVAAGGVVTVREGERSLMKK